MVYIATKPEGIYNIYNYSNTNTESTEHLLKEAIVIPQGFVVSAELIVIYLPAK